MHTLMGRNLQHFVQVVLGSLSLHDVLQEFL